MASRRTPLLLAMIVAIQAVFGGMGGGVVVCLGGGHDHSDHADRPAPADSAPLVECASECEHGSSWPIPLDGARREGECGCVDVEIEAPEWTSPPRPGADGASEGFARASMVPASLAGPDERPRRSAATLPSPGFDPGGAQRIRQIRTTRLIV